MAYTLPQVFQMRKDVQAEYNKQPSATRDAWLRNWWTQYGQKEALDMWNKDNAKPVSPAPVVNKPFENKPVVNDNFVQNNDNMQNAGSYQENPNTPSTPDTGDSALNQLLQQTQQFLNKLIQQGQTINPQIEITPEQTAQFLTQAQKEISPYYSTQMKLAREGLLRDAGYTSDEIASSEAETEKKYGQSLRTLGSNAAESGMALSGGRQLDEQNLAEDTQSAIDQNRRLQEYNMGNKARTFAGEWGGGELPSFSYSSAPKVTAGVGSFGRTLDTKPFYNISDSVYDGLKGSKQYDQEVAQRTRASELEQAFRRKEENKARTLTL